MENLTEFNRLINNASAAIFQVHERCSVNWTYQNA